ncbi:hypothetical protein INR49_032478 [Caranx melampygus]|nr:hypothetical protein INR49_032478 [Caranx melampygus]
MLTSVDSVVSRLIIVAPDTLEEDGGASSIPEVGMSRYPASVFTYPARDRLMDPGDCVCACRCCRLLILGSSRARYRCLRASAAAAAAAAVVVVLCRGGVLCCSKTVVTALFILVIFAVLDRSRSTSPPATSKFLEVALSITSPQWYQHLALRLLDPELKQGIRARRRLAQLSEQLPNSVAPFVKKSLATAASLMTSTRSKDSLSHDYQSGNLKEETDSEVGRHVWPFMRPRGRHPPSLLTTTSTTTLTSYQSYPQRGKKHWNVFKRHSSSNKQASSLQVYYIKLKAMKLYPLLQTVSGITSESHTPTQDWLTALPFIQSQGRSGSARHITSMAEHGAGIPPMWW